MGQDLARLTLGLMGVGTSVGPDPLSFLISSRMFIYNQDEENSDGDGGDDEDGSDGDGDEPDLQPHVYLSRILPAEI